MVTLGRLAPIVCPARRMRSEGTGPIGDNATLQRVKPMCARRRVLAIPTPTVKLSRPNGGNGAALVGGPQTVTKWRQLCRKGVERASLVVLFDAMAPDSTEGFPEPGVPGGW